MGASGCERGCLATWFREQGIGSPPPTPPGPGSVVEAPCPGGLARCSGGVVRVSREHTPAGRCSPEGCQCPWEDAGRCPRGCAAEGVELEIPKELAVQQLCAPAPAEPFATRIPGGLPPEPSFDPPSDADPEGVDAFCEVERYRCARSVVRQCDSGQARPIARCHGGCVQGEGMILEEVPPEAATALLCVRSRRPSP